MVLIENGDLHRGYLPARAVRLVKEWALLHHNELLENWVRARAERPLFRIAPLP